MLEIKGQIDVRCTREAAWALLNEFEQLARLIPSVQQVEVDGDRVNGRVALQLGRLKVSSRIALEVTHRKHMACLKAEGLSFLGETIEKQVAQKGVRGIDSGSVGRLRLHLDLRPSERPEHTALIYEADVDAQGRLKRIYQSILTNKAPQMIEEFATNIRNLLEMPDSPYGAVAAAPSEHAAADSASPSVAPSPVTNDSARPEQGMADGALSAATGASADEGVSPISTDAASLPATEQDLAVPVPRRAGWWQRLKAWFARRFAKKEGAR